MPLDSTNYPLVWISYDHGPDHDHDEDFQALETNLKRGTPFVLLNDSVPTEDHEHSREEKKRTSLWMKKHKAELRTLVLAMIVIEPSAARRLAFKPFGVAFAKFWGYPLTLASSRDEALEIAGKLLSERAGSARLPRTIVQTSFEWQGFGRAFPRRKGAASIGVLSAARQRQHSSDYYQPEDNLDNQSIFTVLANCIRTAKKRRQVVLVTHNPNLAVGADAEQIVYVNLDKAKKYKFSYESGSIENPKINQHIVDVLEGSQPAFVKRRLKYNIQ